MKKILYYIAISVICALPFNSCTLDEETSTDVEKKNFMRDAKEAEIVLQGVYRSTIEDGQYGYHLSILFNLSVDSLYLNFSTIACPSNSLSKFCCFVVQSI